MEAIWIKMDLQETWKLTLTPRIKAEEISFFPVPNTRSGIAHTVGAFPMVHKTPYHKHLPPVGVTEGGRRGAPAAF